MKLMNGTLRPGIVLSVLDNCMIKASSPGLFSAVDEEIIPPIIPFYTIIGAHANQLSTPSIGEEVWILNMSDNPMQLFWFRKDDVLNNDNILNDIKDKSADIPGDNYYENIEILCNREVGTGWASIFFSDGTGWVIRNNESSICIKPNGDIDMDMGLPYRQLIISADGIHIGNKDESPACYGDKTAKILNKICAILSMLGEISKVNPHTMALSEIFGKANDIFADIPEIYSKHVKIS